MGKTFRNTVRFFITNKGTISGENIKIIAEENQNFKIKNKNKNKLVSIKTNDCVLAKVFNSHYINIVEKTLHQKVLEIPLCQKMMKNL